jgi:hypothetical protein
VSWCWFALVEEWPDGADAAAWAREDGERVGVLAAWCRRAKPLRGARRIAAFVIDPDGGPATVSLVLPPDGVRLKFDDVAVQQARRASLAALPFDAVSALLTDSSHFEGAVTVARGADAARLDEDPFARIFGARVLEVDGGLLGRTAPPVGPSIERYGSAEPWPWARFGDPASASEK